MSVVSLSLAEQELHELDAAFAKAEPYFRRWLRPFILGQEAAVNAAVLAGSGSHEERDKNTGRSAAYREQYDSLYVAYDTNRRRLEAEIAKERAISEAQDRAVAEAAGEPDRAGGDDAGDDQDDCFN